MDLYLDVDNTLVYSEEYCRLILNGLYELSISEQTSIFEFRDSKIIGDTIDMCLSDYMKIPKIPYSVEGLNYLRKRYNVILCSSSFTEIECIAKKKYSELLDLPLLLCRNENWKKSYINMRGAIFIDDNFNQLKYSNAEVKIWLKTGLLRNDVKSTFYEADSWIDIVRML